MGAVTDENILEKKKIGNLNYWKLSLGGHVVAESTTNVVGQSSTSPPATVQVVTNQSSTAGISAEQLSTVASAVIDDEFEQFLREEGQSQIAQPDEIHWCIVYSASTNDPLIIDELKPIFGLTRLGTHKVQYKGRGYCLVKPQLDSQGDIVPEVCLSEHDGTDRIFIYQAQEVYVFRELLGISQTYEKNIKVRHGSPVSLIERRINPFHGKVIPNNALNKWFEGTDVTLVVKRFLSVSNFNDIPTVTFKLHNDIERVINRVSRGSIFYVSFIVDRIRRRLSLNFSIPSPKFHQTEDSSDDSEESVE